MPPLASKEYYKRSLSGAAVHDDFIYLPDELFSKKTDLKDSIIVFSSLDEFECPRTSRFEWAHIESLRPFTLKIFGVGTIR